MELLNSSEQSLATGRSDYRISCASDLDLDIPAPLSAVSRYCATLGHKTCHSFTPNSVFQQLWHPRYCLNTVNPPDIRMLVHKDLHQWAVC